MTKVQRYKVGFFSDEWGMSSNTPCLIPADSGYAVKFEDYCKLETELAALKAENEWQPIETAPKDGTVVFVSLHDSNIPQPARFAEGSWEHAWDGYEFSGWDGPTHWMPLPKQPAMAKGEK